MEAKENRSLTAMHLHDCVTHANEDTLSLQHVDVPQPQG